MTSADLKITALYSEETVCRGGSRKTQDNFERERCSRTKFYLFLCYYLIKLLGGHVQSLAISNIVFHCGWGVSAGRGNAHNSNEIHGDSSRFQADNIIKRKCIILAVLLVFRSFRSPSESHGEQLH